VSDVSDPFPFSVPGNIVRKVDAAHGQQALGNSRAAFLGRSKDSREFDRQIFPIRPDHPTPRADFEFHVVDVQDVIPSTGLLNRPALWKPDATLLTHGYPSFPMGDVSRFSDRRRL
jgi:hypothetical protein